MGIMRNTAPWTLSPEEAAQQLQTDLERGLSESEAAARLAKHGPNRIQQQAARSPLRLLLSQFADLMIGLLAAAAVVSALIGEWTDSILIAVIVVANAVIGFVQEWRAERAVEALKKLSEPTAKARRDGHLRELSVAEVVPGDVVEVAAGDFVPADCRLVQAANLETEESALTGESLPVEKTTDAQPAETALPDRRGMLFAGTAAVRGHARAVVAATGMETELGKIATLLESAEAGQTPLQRRLAQLSKRLAIVVLIACLVIFAAGVLREPRDEWDTVLLSHMLLTAVSLAVAAIPEGLPAVITIALALGSQRMASRKAIIRRLAAVETLGSVNVICSDKTGTLTQNRMAAEDLVPVSDGDEGLRELLTAAVLCNDAELSADGKPVGTATRAAPPRRAAAAGGSAVQL
jgi:Ca2+-transporting ATPase